METDTVAGIIGFLAILYVAWRDRNSAGDTLVQDALAIVDELKEQMNAMGDEMEELHGKVRQLEHDDRAKTVHIRHLESLLTLAIGYIDTLKEEMEKHDIKPPPQPEKLLTWLKEQKKEK